MVGRLRDAIRALPVQFVGLRPRHEPEFSAIPRDPIAEAALKPIFQVDCMISREEASMHSAWIDGELVSWKPSNPPPISLHGQIDPLRYWILTNPPWTW